MSAILADNLSGPLPLAKLASAQPTKTPAASSAPPIAPFPPTAAAAEPPASSPPPSAAPAKTGKNKDVKMVTVHYLVHSDAADAVPMYDIAKIPSDLPAPQFRTQITNAMKIDQSAKLACAIYGAGKKQRHAFDTDEQVEHAIKEDLGRQKRSKGGYKGLEIISITPAPKEHVTPTVEAAPAPALPKPSKRKRSLGSIQRRKLAKKIKSKQTEQKLEDTEDSAEFIKHVVYLRHHLRCEGCDAWCFVDPETGGHIRCSITMISKWARLHTQDPKKVTLSEPPNDILFDLKREVTPNYLAPGPSGLNSRNPIVVDSDTNDPPPPYTTAVAVKPRYNSSDLDYDFTNDSDSELKPTLEPVHEPGHQPEELSDSESDESESEVDELPTSTEVIALYTKRDLAK
ncbi:hypothetical protein FRC07_012010 [Ceratobasidium sp. 392]|nr:hypothetical protein FRC07_012010 [Ceratobasidium sp. 392]